MIEALAYLLAGFLLLIAFGWLGVYLDIIEEQGQPFLKQVAVFVLAISALVASVLMFACPSSLCWLN